MAVDERDTESPAGEGHLLLLAAYRNRLFRYPPPIRIVPAEISAAFPVLQGLVESLTA